MYLQSRNRDSDIVVFTAGEGEGGPVERVALEHIHCGFSGSTETSTLPCVK